MSSDDILPAALALSAPERARLAKDLLESLHAVDEGDIEAEWLAVIERRAREVEDGSVEVIEWSEARAEIARRLKSKS